MHRRGQNVPLLVLVIVLLTLLYPALFLGYRVAPEASLKGEAPWRAQMGPYPNPSALAVEAATHLGPRLASVAREGTAVALWNPWIGGGRPGWLASPAEGGAPLPLLAGLLARQGWPWTALIAVEIALALAASFWALRALALGAWPAAIGATAYALAGPVAGHWLDWHGSGLALGPLAMLPALSRSGPPTRRVAAWAAVLFLLLASGAPAVPFIALAAALVLLSRPLLGRKPELAAPLVALVLAAAMVLPSLWLQRNGGEPDAPPPPARVDPPPASLAAFLVPPASDDAVPGGSAAPAAYLGTATLLLAFVGVFQVRARPLGFWLGTLAVGTVVSFAPGQTLERFGISQRPLAVVAFAAAVLAAHGGELLCSRLREGGPRNAAGFAVWALLLAALLPSVARKLPFATPEEAELPSPVTLGPNGAASRMVALLGMLPPDVGATLALADVRAVAFRSEPRYSALLGGRGGELSVTRALNPRVARLGARRVLEPLALHVVSGEIFAHVEVVDVPPADQASPDGLRRTPVSVPPRACRVGLPSLAGVTDVWLERPGLRTQLESDPALVPESDEWGWFAVPPGWPTGTARLAVAGPETPRGVRSVAWDGSGLRLVSEEHGTRLWEWDRARPLAFLAAGFQAEEGPMPAEDLIVTAPRDRVDALRPLAAADSPGRLGVVSMNPTRIELSVEAQREALLVVQVKHRPALWMVTVNGGSVVPERVDGVWTGVRVPGGGSRVVLRARLPLSVWLSALGAALATVALAARGRRP